MVRIKTVSRNDRVYYTLSHTLRKGKKTTSRSRYLGTEIPTNIVSIIAQFRHELFLELWEQQFSTLKQNYQQMLKNMPLSAVEKFHTEFLVRFTYNSNRIEGSTLTLRETAQLLLENSAPNRSLAEIYEAKNHQALFDEMRRYAAASRDLQLNLVYDWHHMLFKDSKSEIAGKLRTEQVRITGSELVPPLPVELLSLLEGFFQWYDNAKTQLHPVELAILVHYKFVCIHPYWDGNGRISRMLLNFVLHKYGYPMYNFLDRDRKHYYNALHRADKNDDPFIFISYFVRRYLKVISKFQ